MVLVFNFWRIERSQFCGILVKATRLVVEVAGPSLTPGFTHVFRELWVIGVEFIGTFGVAHNDSVAGSKKQKQREIGMSNGDWNKRPVEKAVYTYTALLITENNVAQTPYPTRRPKKKAAPMVLESSTSSAAAVNGTQVMPIKSATPANGKGSWVRQKPYLSRNQLRNNSTWTYQVTPWRERYRPLCQQWWQSCLIDWFQRRDIL